MEDMTAHSAVTDAALTAGPSPTSSVKVSCLACRAAKRKCNTPDIHTTCRRCVTHRLLCEYKEHHRGRRKKEVSTVTAVSESDAGDTNNDQIPMARQEGKRVETEGSVVIEDPSDYHFSHLVPSGGDSLPYIQRGIPPPTTTSLERLLRSDCPDPVTAGALSESDAVELFDFYFRHLNVTVAILDPILHTPFTCRDRSPLLYTAVLTVTARVKRPKAYSHCILLANKLIGQTVEHGLCSVEIVQALYLLTHWRKADDGTSWRRVGYAIRMAQELKLHEKMARPLPSDERQAREILNGERAWMHLVVADYHLAMHHSLPRMISDEGIDDPTEWLNDHLHLTMPGESSLGPMITFSRMCRLYADMLEGMTGSISSKRQIDWCEAEWKRWRTRWIVQGDHHFLRQQISTFKLCDAYFRFHIAEARLLFSTRYGSHQPEPSGSAPRVVGIAFRECVESALALADVFQNDFIPYGFLSYCLNLVWVGMAVTAVWLIKNIIPMEVEDRTRVIRVLTQIQASTEEASSSSDDMSAHIHRILKHLLGGIPPEWQFNSLLDQQRSTLPAPPSLAGSTSPLTTTTWTLPNTLPVPQDDVWANHNGASFDVGNALLSLHTPTETMPLSGGAAPGFHNDMLFPPLDDDFWKSLFPPSGAGLL